MKKEWALLSAGLNQTIEGFEQQIRIAVWQHDLSKITGGETIRVQEIETREEITDTERLEWMIENPDIAVVEHQGMWLTLHNPKSKGERFNTPREAIDAAMKESK